MTKAETLQDLIERFPEGKVFGYSELNESGMKHSALVLELNNMVRRGELVRVMRGRFKLQGLKKNNISPEEIIKAICLYRNKVCGYETGTSIWEKWGFVPAEAQRKEFYISTMQMRPAQTHYDYTIRFRRSRLDPASYNHEILQFLDAIEAVNVIAPIAGTNHYFDILEQRFNNWPDSHKNQLATYALSYRPVTRALTGAFLQKLGYGDASWRLAASLHPASTYKICINKAWLDNAVQWKIICTDSQPSKKMKSEITHKH